MLAAFNHGTCVTENGKSASAEWPYWTVTDHRKFDSFAVVIDLIKFESKRKVLCAPTYNIRSTPPLN